MSAAITRRAALAAVPAIAATGILPAISAYAAVEQDPHPKWWAERQEWRRTMSVIGKEIDRREAALPAEVRAPVPLISPPYENRLLADYRAKLARREAAYEQAGINHLDAEFDRCCDRAIALDKLIVETEARTVAGLAIQLRVLEHLAEPFEIDPEELGRMDAEIERLAGGAS